MQKQPNALLSVYNKTGIVGFAYALIQMGFKIWSSGGTAKCLREAGMEVTDVAELVGGGAILGHRVVTLSREVHAGLLARDIPEDIEEMEKLGIPRFDLVCVDLYPLDAEIAKIGSTKESVIDKTDIGGPTMLRSAAKGGRLVICDPADRMLVIERLRAGTAEDESFRDYLRAKAEFIVSGYCLSSAGYHSQGAYAGLLGQRVLACKYGENAWQMPSALYSTGSDDKLGLDKFRILEGTAPSRTTLTDLDRLLQVITHIAAAFDVNRGKVPFIAVGGKHGNPCGAAIGFDQQAVLQRMMAGDKLAIFGGQVMTNFCLTEALAEILTGKMLDGIVAPDFEPKTIEMLKRKKDKCRFIQNGALIDLGRNSLDTATQVRYVRGGFIRQPNYTFVLSFGNGSVASMSNDPSPAMEDNMLLAWAIGSTSNSNTITLVSKNGMLIGNGVGQQDRVGAAQLAIARARRSGHDINGAVAYSDSFFPFPDGPETLADAGVKAIMTSSGSVKDQATIDLCRERGVVLYMVPDAEGRGFFGH